MLDIPMEEVQVALLVEQGTNEKDLVDWVDQRFVLL